MDQPEFGLRGRKYYLVERNDSNLVAYETLMRNIALELGANPSTVNDDIKDVVDFEIQLANVSGSVCRSCCLIRYTLTLIPWLWWTLKSS